MARLRYVRDVKAAQEQATLSNTGPLNNTVRSIRAVYETEPEIAAALLPKPLVPIERPEIFLQQHIFLCIQR